MMRCENLPLSYETGSSLNCFFISPVLFVKTFLFFLILEVEYFISVQ